MALTSNPFNALEFLISLPIGICRTTLEGEIVFCNDRFAQLLGFENSYSLYNSRIVDFYPKQKDRGEFVRFVIQEGKSGELPFQLRKKDGSLLNCYITAKAVADEENVVAYMDKIIRKQSNKEQKNNLQDINALMQQMAKENTSTENNAFSERFLGAREMAGGVAHSMNQPLMVLNNLLQEMLAQVSQQDRLFEKLEAVRVQLEKLNDLAQKIGTVKSYNSTDYLLGEKIVDLHKVSK